VNDASCYLLDVGQGTANVILLGEGRAIIVDGGRSARVPLSLLKSQGVERLELVIASHNDADHSNGIPGILVEYKENIGRIVFLQDRPAGTIAWLNMLRRAITKEEFPLLLDKFHRLETEEDPRRIWSDAAFALDLIYPRFADNLQAQVDDDTNATSAVLVFRRGEQSILFPGDATLEAWRRIHERSGTLACDVVAAPHHGGKLTEDGEDVEFGDLQWLFAEAIHCRGVAVLSVGTTNHYGHPQAQYIAAVREAGATIMCTQLTHKCCDTVASYAPGLIDGLTYRDPISRCGMSSIPADERGRGCAGTVRVALSDDGVRVENLGRHQAAVDGLTRSGEHPMCRPLPV